MTEIRVLIVEDEPLIADDIANSLNTIDYKVAGIAYSSEKALELLYARKPDIALLDINIKGSLSGIDLGHIINEKYQIPFVFLTSFSDKTTVDEAKKTMPYGYVLKPFSAMELYTSLEMALYRFANENKGELPLLDHINQHIPSSLTSKEYEVLQDLCQGYNNKQISERQFISVNTVKTHVRQILTKLDAPNRTSVMHRMSKMK
ncbi:MAG: response regulator transcription factor [Lewinellaceae bacterium]|nr:response regulator transcription factor [Lewinellaceae bacterium]